MIGLDEVKNHWDGPAKVAAWLTGIVSLFLVEPPRLWHSTAALAQTSNPAQWLHLSQFILAILVGLFFLKSGKPANRGRLRYLAVGLLLLAIVLFIANQFLIASWTCGYIDEVVVVGQTYSELANGVIDPAMTCTRLIGLAHGETADLWPKQEILFRYITVAGLYTLTMLAFSAAALAMIDYIRSGQKAVGTAAAQ